jgi:hypothetical protein
MGDWKSSIDLGALKGGPVGVIYAAVGAEYLAEATVSARTVKQWMPDVPVTLFTSEAGAGVDPACFDQVVRIAEAQGSFEDKIIAMRCSPYEKTLFLDTDTYLCESVADVFAVLDRFDFAAALEPCQHDPTFGKVHAPEAGEDLPDAIIEHTSGVIAYKRTAAVAEMLEDWYPTYVRGRAAGIKADQVTLRTCLYRSRVRIATLPCEYNFRLPAAQLAFGRIRLLHGRENFAKMERKLNRSTNEMRLSLPRLGVLSKQNPVFRVLNFVRRVRHWVRPRKG